MATTPGKLENHDGYPVLIRILQSFCRKHRGLQGAVRFLLYRPSRIPEARRKALELVVIMDNIYATHGLETRIVVVLKYVNDPCNTMSQ